MFDGDFKFTVHVILFLFSLALLLLKLSLFLADAFEAFLDILETSFGVAVTHHVDLVVSDRLLQIRLLDALIGKRTLQSQHTRLQLSHDKLTVLDLRLDI